MVTERIKIYPWATDTAGCFYQRLKMPLDALERAYPDEFEVCWSCEPKAPGVVLGQRIMGNGTEGDPRWLEYCRDPGILAVYEIDDDILDLDPGNTIPYRIFTPNREGTICNIAAADQVIASTPNLAAKLAAIMLDKPIHVASNCVAEDSIIEREAPKNRAPVIGWAGSMFHRQDFPPELVAQLASVRDRHSDVRWLTIGANYLGWGSHYGWSSIDRYHRSLLNLDIGIAPIARTPFNASKSWIKALDYMAKGVVPVVEDWGQYPDLIGDAGLIVQENDWFVALTVAINAWHRGEFDHRAIAERAREFTISRQVYRWADVFRKAREL